MQTFPPTSRCHRRSSLESEEGAPRPLEKQSESNAQSEGEKLLRRPLRAGLRCAPARRKLYF
ncbi:hypothetical protein E2320_014545 [Naja naja]|nr:hypothetical protein E2320_014545 [Naja naja]